MRKPAIVILAMLVGGCTAGCGGDGEARGTRVEAATTATPTPDGEPVVPLAIEPRLPSRTDTYSDEGQRFRITFPANWHVASRDAMDRINDMAGNLIAVATFPIRPTAEAACSDQVDEPRVLVGDTDALVLVGHDLHARADLAQKRPASFRLFEQAWISDPDVPGQPVLFPWLCRGQVGVSGMWVRFGDSGRVFTVGAIIGKDASEETQGQTLGVLNSMEFDSL